jgi:hypothetical protein
MKSLLFFLIAGQLAVGSALGVSRRLPSASLANGMLPCACVDLLL